MSGDTDQRAYAIYNKIEHQSCLQWIEYVHLSMHVSLNKKIKDLFFFILNYVWMIDFYLFLSLLLKNMNLYIIFLCDVVCLIGYLICFFYTWIFSLVWIR